VDHAGRQVEQEIDQARPLGTPEQAAVVLLQLRSDTRQHPNRREQGIEEAGPHAASVPAGGASLKGLKGECRTPSAPAREKGQDFFLKANDTTSSFGSCLKA